MRRIVVVGAWNIAILFAGLVALELIFGGWTGSLRTPSLWRLSIYRDVSWSMPTTSLYGGEVAAYRRDKFGLRGSFGAPSEANILVLGGSTTDERFVGEGETWPDVLASCLNEAGRPARVANAGVSGQSSRGHILNFELWLQHIPNLRPQYVLVYIGVNENLLDERQKNDDVRAFNESGRPLWIERLKLNSALYGLYKIIDGNLAAYRAGVHHVRGSTGARTTAAEALDREYRDQRDNAVEIGSPEYEQRLEQARQTHASQHEAYGSRLAELGRAIEGFGAQTILATQTEGPFRLEGNMVRGDLSRYFALEAINEVTRAYCKETSALCLDVARDLEVDDGDFYDAVHTTPKGSRKVALAMCRRLAGERQFTLTPSSG